MYNNSLYFTKKHEKIIQACFLKKIMLLHDINQ